MDHHHEAMLCKQRSQGRAIRRIGPHETASRPASAPDRNKR
jgi:hypothetical protein